MNKVFCSLSYVFVSFLLYTTLDQNFVQSSPINSDGTNRNSGTDNGYPLNTAAVQNSDSNHGEVNIDSGKSDNQLNVPNEGHYKENQGDVDDNQKNDDADQQNLEDGQDDFSDDKEDTSDVQDDREDQMLNEGVRERVDTEGSRVNDGSILGGETDGKGERSELPIDPEEGQAAEASRIADMTRLPNPYGDSVKENSMQIKQDSPNSLNSVSNTLQKQLFPNNFNRLSGNANPAGLDQSNQNNPNTLNSVVNPAGQNQLSQNNPNMLNSFANPAGQNQLSQIKPSQLSQNNPNMLSSVVNPAGQNQLSQNDPNMLNSVPNATGPVQSNQNNPNLLNSVANPAGQDRFGQINSGINRIPSLESRSYNVSDTLRSPGLTVTQPGAGVQATQSPDNNQPLLQLGSSNGIVPVKSQNPSYLQAGVSQPPGNSVNIENQQTGTSYYYHSVAQGAEAAAQQQNPVHYSQDSQDKALSRQTGSQQKEDFQNSVSVQESDKDTHSNNQYSEDGYLDAPANLDNERISEKTDEDTNRNNNYDESSDPNANLNNKNIIDDNNEDAIYNGDNNAESNAGQGERKQDSDEDYNDYDDDYSYEEKIDRIDGDDTKTTVAMPTEKDDWYDSDGDDIVNGDEDDKEDKDFEDTVVDEEVEFQRTHPKHKHHEGDDNSLYFSNVDMKIPESVVEYKLVRNRNSLNAPSSMVLFYTWIILIVLIAVVTLSAFRYRCKGIVMNGSRNYRNGNHGNYRSGEENKKLLENVYT